MPQSDPFEVLPPELLAWLAGRWRTRCPVASDSMIPEQMASYHLVGVDSDVSAESDYRASEGTLEVEPP